MRVGVEFGLWSYVALSPDKYHFWVRHSALQLPNFDTHIQPLLLKAGYKSVTVAESVADTHLRHDSLRRLEKRLRCGDLTWKLDDGTIRKSLQLGPIWPARFRGLKDAFVDDHTGIPTEATLSAVATSPSTQLKTSLSDQPALTHPKVIIRKDSERNTQANFSSPPLAASIDDETAVCNAETLLQTQLHPVDEQCRDGTTLQHRDPAVAGDSADDVCVKLQLQIVLRKQTLASVTTTS